MRRRSQAIKKQIVDAAEARRNELLSNDLTRNLRPAFAFVPRAETRDGRPIDVLHMKLADRDAAAVTQLQQLFGPDWSKIRLAAHGNQLVVLLGSDTRLLDGALTNLKENHRGLADAPVYTDFLRHADPGSQALEVHLSTRMALALAKAEDLKDPKAFTRQQSLSSLAVIVEPDRLQIDIWLPRRS